MKDLHMLRLVTPYGASLTKQTRGQARSVTPASKLNVSKHWAALLSLPQEVGMATGSRQYRKLQWGALFVPKARAQEGACLDLGVWC